MASHAWVLGVQPGYEEEYKRRHDELWPEMDACLRAAGIRNYHIFRHGLTLFGYFETDDLDRTIAILKDDPSTAAGPSTWPTSCASTSIPGRAFPFLLPKQWSLD
jgi:L-rhamnose mutarotase